MNEVPEQPKNMTPQQADVENRFTYHAPHGTQPERYVRLRTAARDLAHLIVELTPVSREQSLALTKLEESVFFANASIARNEPHG